MGRPIENTRLVVRSLIGNALENKPSNYGAYLRAIRDEKPSVYNPSGKTIAASLINQTDIALAERQHIQEELLTTPWVSRRGRREKINPSRAASSIIAYTNVQGRRIADEYFPVDEMKMFLRSIEVQSAKIGRALTVPEQYAVALSLTQDNPVAAAILAHGAFRAIARNKDTKVSPDLDFPLEQMVAFARSTADFHTVNSPSRDPLGDTYHWWASYSAGLIFTLSQKDHPIQSRFLTTLFYHDAALTTLVRKTILHRTDITNHHKDVDRQALQAGITMGNFLKNM